MKQPSENLFLNRELSWLEFNSRVLEEAADPTTPLLERLRFYCIFYSNLDEFFMVRVASLFHLIEEGNTRRDPAGFTPRRQLEMVFSRVRELEAASYELYANDLLPALEREGIRILPQEAISEAQQSYLDDYFEKEIYPVLTPLALDGSHPFPRLVGLASNLAVLLRPEKDSDGPERLAVVQIPGRLPGLTRLPDTETLQFCWLSDVIRRRVGSLFRGYRVIEAAGFRLIRDAQVELDDEGWDDYVGMLESQLRKRRAGWPVRLAHEASITPELLERIEQGLGIEKIAVLPIRGPLDPRPLLSIADLPGHAGLRYPPQPPLAPEAFEGEEDVFEVIRRHDVLLHHPYDSFDPVVEFIDRAADDPEVLAVKQTLYRTSGADSPIVNALIRAAENGKQVTVLVELTARFDEERNINWARDLEKAGAHVIFGLSGLKAHAKIALVVRRESEGLARYVHLGTGNYNERTAKLYTDFGMFTAADDFGRDASGFFNTITGYSEPPVFSRLVMAPAGLRDAFLSLIRREAERAAAGQASWIMAKMNSLVDTAIIRALYDASRAGVGIRLNVRGICCLRPGVPGLSENISVVSIVDRYLEHSRAFVFHNGGDVEVYLSSADWMPRNLDRRVELMFPVVDASAKARAIEALQAQFADNRKSRLLGPDGSYDRLAALDSDLFRVQERLYRNLLAERERNRIVTPVRFAPIERKGP